MNLAPDLVVADRFRLISPLGHGGMGSVWLAHHLALDIRCAVKFIGAEASQSQEMISRFEREARAVAQIQSPHVVQIFDRGVWMGTPFIAMEYLNGEDLGKRLARRRTLSPSETYFLVADICRALAKAHAVGLVHRDLKPPNIFLVAGDEREIAKVLDFGIAKDTTLAAEESTKTGALLGTPFYMSPEQARADRMVDHRSDLWAVAVIAFQCLTGRRPFTGSGLGVLFMKILVEPLPVPSQVGSVPPGFDGFWARGSARDPNERFQSTRELVEALAIALDIPVTGPFERSGQLSAPSLGQSTQLPTTAAVSAVTPLPSQAGSAQAGAGEPKPAAESSVGTRSAASELPQDALNRTGVPLHRSIRGAAPPGSPTLLTVALPALGAVALAGALALILMPPLLPRASNQRAPSANAASATGPQITGGRPPADSTAKVDARPAPLESAEPPPSSSAPIGKPEGESASGQAPSAAPRASAAPKAPTAAANAPRAAPSAKPAVPARPDTSKPKATGRGGEDLF